MGTAGGHHIMTDAATVVAPKVEGESDKQPMYVERGDRCDSCGLTIETTEVHIKCAQCADFDLCVNCFASGAEVTTDKHKHLSTHRYHVMEALNFPLLGDEWTSDEELSLLFAIKSNGLNNWTEVGEFVATKSRDKCRNHYATFYLDGPAAPMPDLSKVTPKRRRDTVSGIADRNPEKEDEEEKAQTRRRMNKEKEEAKNVPGAELAGYMPLRGEFDVEWDNDAELILADMEFVEGEPQAERDLKLKILEIYNSKLDERAARKKFTLERGLLDFKRLQAFERKRSKEEREITQQMRLLARFHSQEHHEQFVNGLIEEMRIRKKIDQLMKYRQLGIRTLAEADQYEAEKKKRDQAEAQRKQKESAAYLYNTGRTTQRGSRWLNRDKEGGATSLGGSGVLDINDAQAVNLLSEEEIKLCSTLRLLPQQYLIIKNLLVTESARAGFLDRTTATQILQVDVHKVGSIYDFFVQHDWVQPKA